MQCVSLSLSKTFRLALRQAQRDIQYQISILKFIIVKVHC